MVVNDGHRRRSRPDRRRKHLSRVDEAGIQAPSSHFDGAPKAPPSVEENRMERLDRREREKRIEAPEQSTRAIDQGSRRPAFEHDAPERAHRGPAFGHRAQPRQRLGAGAPNPDEPAEGYQSLRKPRDRAVVDLKRPAQKRKLVIDRHLGRRLHARCQQQDSALGRSNRPAAAEYGGGCGFRTYPWYPESVVPEAERLPAFSGVWVAFRALPSPEAVDPNLLTDDERPLFDALATPSRRAEWWAGRMAARGALRAVGAGAASVLRAPNGAPLLYGPHAAQATVAITHGRRWAGAVAARVDGPTAHVGLDLVDAEDLPRVDRVAPRNFTPLERAHMSRDPRVGLLAWAAREAAAKATRTGMFAYALSLIHVTEVDAPAGTLTLNEPGFDAAYTRSPDDGWLVFVRATADAHARAQTIARARNAPADH